VVADDCESLYRNEVFDSCNGAEKRREERREKRGGFSLYARVFSGSEVL